MSLQTLLDRYKNHYATIAGQHERDDAAALAVGGEFYTVGALEYYVLKAHGLNESTHVVDIGCGTGRLAAQLASRKHPHYSGFDIMESAVTYARKLCQMPAWKFGVTDGLRVDVPDASGDMACFFSVFTHITHEHTFLYLKETARLLKPGGIVIFTYLEFAIPSHWDAFAKAVSNFGNDGEPVVFLDRAGITQFANYLDFEVLALVDGDKPTFPIEEELTLQSCVIMKDRGLLGQSIAILRKRVK
ncbi:MAG: methyltransferase domain protein [Verrucomicrobia bacterium]|nr:methyltransferase domain protein [Verrucomicrobiota bacterium]